MAKRRKNGAGTVRLRTDGRWEGRVVVGYDENGQPKTKSVLAKTKKECLEKLEVLKAQVGKPKKDKLSPEMPFADWLEYWYTTCVKDRLRPNTQAGYESRMRLHIIPELGAIPLNKLTQNDLQQFYTQLKQGGRKRYTDFYGQGLSDRMVRSCHACCRTALEKAVEEKLIRVNPAVGCKLPPKKAKEMQVLSHEEMRRFLIQAKEEGYYEPFLLELSTGLRRGELLALQWDDLNFETGELRIDKQVARTRQGLTVMEPKTKATVRTIVLPRPVVEVLREHRQVTDSRWMFPSPVKEDSPLDPSSCRSRMQLILEHAGCKKVRFHDLRHTFATMAIEYGMDFKTLSTVIGHESVATTLDIYTHITDDMQRQAAVSIDRLFGGEGEPCKAEAPKTATSDEFTPYKGNRRRAGTGYVKQIGPNTWEGRYSPVWPDGKKHARNIYAKTEAECEEKLAALIVQMKAEIKAAKEVAKEGAKAKGKSGKKSKKANSAL